MKSDNLPSGKVLNPAARAGRYVFYAPVTRGSVFSVKEFLIWKENGFLRPNL